jgi:hypothetical protein
MRKEPNPLEIGAGLDKLNTVPKRSAVKLRLNALTRPVGATKTAPLTKTIRRQHMKMIYQIQSNKLEDACGSLHLRAMKIDSMGRTMNNQPFTDLEAERVAQVTGLTFTDLRSAVLKARALNRQLREEVA